MLAKLQKGAIMGVVYFSMEKVLLYCSVDHWKCRFQKVWYSNDLYSDPTVIIKISLESHHLNCWIGHFFFYHMARILF